MEIVFATPPPRAALRAAVRDTYRGDKTEAVAHILAAAEFLLT